MTEEVSRALQAAREAFAEAAEQDDAHTTAARYRAGANDDTGEVRRATRAAEIALAHLPTDLSEERAREVLAQQFDDPQGYAGTAIDIRRGSFVGIPAERAVRAMQQYAAGLQVEVERLREIAREAEFLCARIDELDWCESLEETARQHAGHVDPPLARLKGLLTALGDTQ